MYMQNKQLSDCWYERANDKNELQPRTGSGALHKRKYWPLDLRIHKRCRKRGGAGGYPATTASHLTDSRPRELMRGATTHDTIAI